MSIFKDTFIFSYFQIFTFQDTFMLSNNKFFRNLHIFKCSYFRTPSYVTCSTVSQLLGPSAKPSKLLASSGFYLFASSGFCLFASSGFYLFASSGFYLFAISGFCLFASSGFYLFAISGFCLSNSPILIHPIFPLGTEVIFHFWKVWPIWKTDETFNGDLSNFLEVENLVISLVSI